MSRELTRAGRNRQRGVPANAYELVPAVKWGCDARLQRCRAEAGRLRRTKVITVAASRPAARWRLRAPSTSLRGRLDEAR